MGLPACNYSFEQARPYVAYGAGAGRAQTVRHRPPARVYWFFRALVVVVFLLVAWVSGLMVEKFNWTLMPEDTTGSVQPTQQYLIVDDVGLPLSSQWDQSRG